MVSLLSNLFGLLRIADCEAEEHDKRFERGDDAQDEPEAEVIERDDDTLDLDADVQEGETLLDDEDRDPCGQREVDAAA